MQLDLNGKVAIVTGAGRGIGRTIARTLAAEGVTVAVTDIREDLVESVTNEWDDNGWPGVQLITDVRKVDDCKAVARDVLRDFGRIDILVNNAGVASGAPVDLLSEQVWDDNIDTNLKGPMLMCQAVIPAMRAQESGRIINASSFAAIIPSLGGAAYASSKAGIESLTRILAGELGRWGITVNAYAPGMIPTEMNHYGEATPERKEQLLDTLSLRRWGDPQDIANLIVFLSSDQAAYITGALIDISGGKFATQMPWMAHRG